MERYFERIQGRVYKIGRTRMVPEIVLKDSASKGLDALLDKINRVKSQVIQASANVNLNVKQTAANANLKKAAKVNSNVQQQTVANANASASALVDFSPLTQALQVNSEAVLKFTIALGSLKLGGQPKEDKPNSIWDKIKNGFGAAKSIGSGVKNTMEIPEKILAIRDAFQGKTEDKCCCCKNNLTAGVGLGTSARGSGRGRTRGRFGFRRRGEKLNTPTLSTEQVNPATKKGRFRKVVGAAGGLLEGIGSIGSDFIGGFQDFGKLFGGQGDKSGITSTVSKDLSKGSSVAEASTPKVPEKNAAIASAPKELEKSVAESAPKGIGKIGKASGFMKGLGKKLLGPLSFLSDAASIATAAPGKERAKAIGSTVGGGIGSAIGGFFGSVIPGAGTYVGSALGGAAGSWLGEKAGAIASDAGKFLGEVTSKVGDFIGDKWSKVTDFFSFGKKKEPEKEKPAIAEPSAAPAAPKAPAVASPTSPALSSPLMPGAFPYSFSPMPFAGPLTPTMPYGQIPALNAGPRIQDAVSGAASGGKTTPQMVQISPEQMTSLSAGLKDFKTETTMNYNLPPGAVQVTVREEHPVDVEGLILQIGQRLRTEFNKATQNRKPPAKAPM